MTLTIGRISFDNGPDAGSIQHSGDQLVFAIDIDPGTLTEAKVMRQQVLGLAERDESAVPITWTDDPDWDGFYDVRSVAVTPISNYLTEGWMKATFTVERVGGYAEPVIDLYAVGAVRANSHGVTNPDGIMCVTEATTHMSYDIGGATVFVGSRRTSASGVGLAEVEVTSSPPWAGSVTFGTPPSTRYDAMCVIETQVDGFWYPVVGSQIPAGSTIRMSNDFIRVSTAFTANPVPFDPNNWVIEVAGTDGLSSPITALTESFQLFENGETNHIAPGSAEQVEPIILTNTPQKVTVRFEVAGSAVWNSHYVDLTIRAGSLHVEGYEYHRNRAASIPSAIGIKANAVTACTAVTGGIERTNADGTGAKWHLISPSAITVDTTNGDIKLTDTAAAAFPFAIGFIGASAADTAAQLRDRYWCATSITETVASR